MILRNQRRTLKYFLDGSLSPNVVRQKNGSLVFLSRTPRNLPAKIGEQNCRRRRLTGLRLERFLRGDDKIDVSNLAPSLSSSPLEPSLDNLNLNSGWAVLIAWNATLEVRPRIVVGHDVIVFQISGMPREVVHQPFDDWFARADHEFSGSLCSANVKAG